MPRQVRFDQYGGVDVLHLSEVDKPEPGEGQLLLQVKAAGLNPFDVKVRTGKVQEMVKVSFPSAQGNDVAGVVEAVGPGVSGFKPGDEVAASTSKRGAQGDFALAPQTAAILRPANVPWEVAGSVWVVGTTSQAMVRAAAIGADDLVLVSGASGGVGAIASQLARHRGAAVIGVAGESNHKWLLSHGITPVTYGDDVEARIRAAAAAAGREVTAALDLAGGGYVELAVKLGVAPERIDTIVDYGAAAKHGAKTEGGAAGTTADIAELLALINDGEIELPIHASFPLEQVQAAYTELEHGHPRGKIVLVP
jgi:NADPH:quinone reductase-like Zn-dependent oxidoreductase